jgi:starch phosphorylase
MTAAMCGAVNVSTNDGWIREFIEDGKNGFVVPIADYENMSTSEQDEYDMNQLFDILEKQIIPMYYDNPAGWRNIVQQGMKDVRVTFDSNRMAREYYEILYK